MKAGLILILMTAAAFAALVLISAARAQPERPQWASSAIVTNYSNLAGPTHWGGWDVPAPGDGVFACSADIAPLSTVRILNSAGLTLAIGRCWDTGNLGTGDAGRCGCLSWIDTSEDLGFDGVYMIEVS